MSVDLSKIRVVLIETSHPGNIGSTARAMKLMGLSQLVLVNPKRFPDPKANELASRADDILNSAQVVSSLAEALSECSLVIGMSAREREMPQTLLNPKQAALLIHSEYEAHAGIALVFGRESAGLTNDELELCPFQVKIPAVESYSSLNLAAAVQVIAYEIFSTFQDAEQPHHESTCLDFASYSEMEGMYTHMKEAMIALHFLKPDNPRHMMQRVRQIFNRARLDQEDVNLLRGFMNAILYSLS